MTPTSLVSPYARTTEKVKYSGVVILYLSNTEILRLTYIGKKKRQKIIGRWMEEFGCDFTIGILPDELEA